MSTLSVEISTIVSSACTVSPTAFIQRLIVPSETLTPICGMTTSTDSAIDASSASLAHAGRPAAPSETTASSRPARPTGARSGTIAGRGARRPDRARGHPQGVRRARRARRPRPARAGGVDHGLPRPERRWQDDDAADPRRAPARRRRQRPRARRRSLARRRGARPHRLPADGARLPRPSQRPRRARPPRGALGAAARAARRGVRGARSRTTTSRAPCARTRAG